MGLLDKLFGAPAGRPVNIEDAMNSIEDDAVDMLHEPAQYYVKPLALENDTDISVAESEVRQGNVVLLSIMPLSRNPASLKTSLSRLSAIARDADGDIARISEDKIIMTPARMKIAKSAKKR